MKESEYRSYDDLPLFLNSATVAKGTPHCPSGEGWQADHLGHQDRRWHPHHHPPAQHSGASPGAEKIRPDRVDLPEPTEARAAHPS